MSRLTIGINQLSTSREINKAKQTSKIRLPVKSAGRVSERTGVDVGRVWTWSAFDTILKEAVLKMDEILYLIHKLTYINLCKDWYLVDKSWQTNYDFNQKRLSMPFCGPYP